MLLFLVSLVVSESIFCLSPKNAPDICPSGTEQVDSYSPIYDIREGPVTVYIAGSVQTHFSPNDMVQYTFIGVGEGKNITFRYGFFWDPPFDTKNEIVVFQNLKILSTSDSIVIRCRATFTNVDLSSLSILQVNGKITSDSKSLTSFKNLLNFCEGVDVTFDGTPVESPAKLSHFILSDYDYATINVRSNTNNDKLSYAGGSMSYSVSGNNVLSIIGISRETIFTTTVSQSVLTADVNDTSDIFSVRIRVDGGILKLTGASILSSSSEIDLYSGVLETNRLLKAFVYVHSQVTFKVKDLLTLDQLFMYGASIQLEIPDSNRFTVKRLLVDGTCSINSNNHFYLGSERLVYNNVAYFSTTGIFNTPNIIEVASASIKIDNFYFNEGERYTIYVSVDFDSHSKIDFGGSTISPLCFFDFRILHTEAAAEKPNLYDDLVDKRLVLAENVGKVDYSFSIDNSADVTDETVLFTRERVVYEIDYNDNSFSFTLLENPFRTVGLFLYSGNSDEFLSHPELTPLTDSNFSFWSNVISSYAKNVVIYVTGTAPLFTVAGTDLHNINVTFIGLKSGFNRKVNELDNRVVIDGSGFASRVYALLLDGVTAEFRNSQDLRLPVLKVRQQVSLIGDITISPSTYVVFPLLLFDEISKLVTSKSLHVTLDEHSTDTVTFNQDSWTINEKTISYDYDLTLLVSSSDINLMWSTSSPKRLNVTVRETDNFYLNLLGTSTPSGALVYLSSTSRSFFVTSRTSYIPVKFVTSFNCIVKADENSSSFSFPEQDIFVGADAKFDSDYESTSLSIPVFVSKSGSYQTILTGSNVSVTVNNFTSISRNEVYVKDVLVKHIYLNNCTGVYMYPECLSETAVSYNGYYSSTRFPSLHFYSTDSLSISSVDIDVQSSQVNQPKELNHMILTESSSISTIISLYNNGKIKLLRDSITVSGSKFKLSLEANEKYLKLLSTQTPDDSSSSRTTILAPAIGGVIGGIIVIGSVVTVALIIKKKLKKKDTGETTAPTSSPELYQNGLLDTQSG